MPVQSTTDCLVVGGGIVGLSIAYQLAGDGFSVRLLDRGEPGRAASWAGAGILPPGSWFSSHPALEKLAAINRPLHERWSVELREATGVDDEFEVEGAFYTTPDDLPQAAREHLNERLAAWQADGIESQELTANELHALEPELKPIGGYLVPGEGQVRNPRRLTALKQACEDRGVQIESHTGVEGFRHEAGRLTSVQTASDEFQAGAYCLAAGAWTGRLGEQLGIVTPTTPIRGQIVLLRTPERRLQRVCHFGGRYFAPRRDGRVLVGSTVEEAGFDTTTRPEDIDSLITFAHAAMPSLADAIVETRWAGLRPASGDALPMIGRLPRFSNGWIAAGHFRSGLQFAPATAVALSQLLRGEAAALDLSPFDPSRFASASAETSVRA